MLLPSQPYCSFFRYIRRKIIFVPLKIIRMMVDYCISGFNTISDTTMGILSDAPTDIFSDTSMDILSDATVDICSVATAVSQPILVKGWILNFRIRCLLINTMSLMT